MTGKHVLITGGAGFIGSHVADALLARGYSVRAIDSLVDQVHGPLRVRPDYLDPDVELIVEDIRDPDALRKALQGIDVVYHFATTVGVGQSMYKIADYVHNNNYGTAVLLQQLVDHPVERLVVASSMSIYGEGPYINSRGMLDTPRERTREQLMARNWEVVNADGETLKPVPTPETKSPTLASIYALSKYDQEQMCLMIGRAYGIPTIALRFFNTYGTRQALSNPYTGVLAIFAARILNNEPPLIYEDGHQLRDFVCVRDVAQACLLAMEKPDAVDKVFNVASGVQHRVQDVAELMCNMISDGKVKPETSGKYRVGDVRHCFADISMARQFLDYEPQVSLEAGLAELVEWLQGQTADDMVIAANEELSKRGLAI